MEKNQKPPENVPVSLRDYFAAHALAAIIAKSPFVAGATEEHPMVIGNVLGAYLYADLMMAHREKSNA